jgi:prevent-host-death family protein
MTVRQISISEFKAHCTEEIREVEKGELVLELTRHGKTVAVVHAGGLGRQREGHRDVRPRLRSARPGIRS